MQFEDLLQIVGDEPIFETGLLLAGDVDPGYVRVQLARWVAVGRLHRLRRGLYCLAPPYRKVLPHPFLVANRLRPGSYVSLQSALAYYGMIPEYVAITTSVTTRRPAQWNTPLGTYDYRHIQTALLTGYRLVDVAERQKAFLATPSKALFDLLYLTPRSSDPAYLQELRLGNPERLDLAELQRYMELAQRPSLLQALQWITTLDYEETDQDG